MNIINKQNVLETKTLFSALRPPRVAIFVDTRDHHWKKTMLHIFEILPAIWGGDGFVLIPSDGHTILPIFQELLRVYDPDFIVCYQRTGNDLLANNPRNFERQLDSYVESFLKQNPDWKDSDIRSDCEKELKRASLDGDFDLEEEVDRYILKDLSVYHYRDEIREVALDYSGTLPHILPRLVDVLCSSDKISNLKIVELNLKNHAIDYQLMGYGMAGKSDLLVKHLIEKRDELTKLLPKIRRHTPDELQNTEKMLDHLNRAISTQIERFSRSDSSVLYKSIWQRQLDLDGIDFREAWRATTKGKKQKRTRELYDFFTRVPFRISTHGLSYYFRRKDYLKNEQGNPLVIVGNSIADFCLYYSLNRLRSKVYWVPYSRLSSEAKNRNGGNYSFLLINELMKESRHADEKEIHWTSASLNDERRRSVPDLFDKNELIKTGHAGEIKDHLIYVDNPKKLLSYVLRLYEKGNANNRSAYQFIDGKGINFVDTPSPKSFNATDPIKHKWISEISITDHAYPTADFLSRGVFSAEGVNFAHLDTMATRVSYSGIHYQCPAMGFISSSDEVSERLVRPKVNLISPQTIFEGYFTRGHYDIRLSDKGSYFLQILQRFEGIENLASLIKNKDAFDLFDLYTSSTNTVGVYNRGVYLQTERRRYVDFTSLCALLEQKYAQNTPKNAAELIDFLIKLNILERGHILKCVYCKSSTWYLPTETGRNFLCRRCGASNLIQQASLRLQAPDFRYEPKVYYKLDELFFQFWSNNGWITALTLAKVKEKSEGSLIFMPETEFRRDSSQERPDFEIDILAILDGNLYFGEAKRDANSANREDRLSVAQIDRLLHFNDILPLKGLIFTSWLAHWPTDVLTKFTDIGTLSQFELIKFINTDLM